MRGNVNATGWKVRFYPKREWDLRGWRGVPVPTFYDNTSTTTGGTEESMFEALMLEKHTARRSAAAERLL